MIPVQTWYKTHDGELLAIVEAFKTWRIIWKVTSIKFSFLSITKTFIALCIQNTWVLVRFVGLKNFLAITFDQIIVKGKQTELQILYLVFFS